MKTFAILAAIATLAATTASAAPIPANIAAALADPARPAADTARDAARKPGALLAFTGVRTGAKVVDLIMGGGYFTRILSPAVGPTGKVYAYQPAEFVGFSADYGKALKDVAAAHPNVTPIGSAFAALDLPDGLDLVFTVQNYHDMHLKPFAADTAAKVNAEIFKSLKKGGVYLVVDHAALPGTGIAPADTLHRIDIAAVTSEVEAAGFKLVARSSMLATPADPHTANVFDPAIRGKTDQFILKFRKP